VLLGGIGVPRKLPEKVGAVVWLRGDIKAVRRSSFEVA